MAIYFKDLRIESFRGMKDLEILGLKDINIIAGNNNVGKTSVLEAISLLKNPHSFYEVLKTCLIREEVSTTYDWYENFISMFPRNNMYIRVVAHDSEDQVILKMAGRETNLLALTSKEKTDAEVRGFVGELFGADSKRMQRLAIEYSYLTNINDFQVEGDTRNIVYVPPGAHLRGNVFGRIVRNESYKEICIRLLQLFDEDIIDLLYLDNEVTKRAVEYVKHKTLGIMPLASYGDGIKRVLALANSIALAAGGILMIDEVETSINYKYYHDIFGFLVKACRQYKVQIFITTHNIEAIDAILETQDYAKDDEYDPINVITFRKDEDTSRICSRSLSGREAYADRQMFNLEVRI